MINLVNGDILKSNAEAIVNTVNCVGIMGRGIAAQFKKAFPENFKAYQKLCARKGLHPGQIFMFELPEDLYSSHRYVINFPTKRHWKGKSKIEDIQIGLETLAAELMKKNISSVAIPPLGCGLGGLDWAEVMPLIQKAFSKIPSVNVYLYEPKGAPNTNEMVNRTRKPNMTIGRAALLGLMKRYVQGLMDTNISLLELHKLMYFMQETGEPLRLRFAKAAYGPFASNLGNVLSHIENHFITGYGDGGDNPQKHIEYIPEASEEAEKFLSAHNSTNERFNRVVDLIQGFESPYGMELLSTIHWLCKYEGAKNAEDLMNKIPEWSSRKTKIIEERHVKVAWEVLHKKGWL